ncbi:MAG: alpha/beta fold hydrolase [Candidatus Sericytochromatia bacterium]|nr:alpha/beta fold hydrolase [Candidatus Sericytochromatia bacterium]
MSEPISLYHGHFFNRNGLNYHYLDQGQGDPVVMVHGNPTWSVYYRNLVKALSPHFRCIVPDHIGCGYSDKPDDSQYNYTLGSRIDDLEALLNHLGVNKNVTLVVHDWGGLIGLGWALRHMDAVKRLVIFNTAAFHLPSSKRQIPWQLALGRQTRLGAWLIENLNAFSVAASWVGCTEHPMSAKLRKIYQSPYNTKANRIATLRFVQDIPLHPEDPAYALVSEVEDNLERFRHLPTLICWGLKDFVFDGDFLKVFEDKLPQAEVHRFAQAGHYVLEDMAAEIVPLVQAFMGQKAPEPVLS